MAVGDEWFDGSKDPRDPDLWVQLPAVLDQGPFRGAGRTVGEPPPDLAELVATPATAGAVHHAERASW
jgi:hypothetical protein